MDNTYLKNIQFRELPNNVEDCHKLIQDLLQVINDSFPQIDKLAQEVKKLAKENNALKERLNTNSANSSLSPSRDKK